MRSKTNKQLAIVAFAVTAMTCSISLSGCSGQQAPPISSKLEPASGSTDFMVVASRPSKLHLIDLKKFEIINQCDIPGPGEAAPGTIVMSPDTQTAYVLGANFSDVYGIDLDSCELVFSTQQSSGGERVKSIASLAISPDGSEIYTHQNPVLLMSDHYEAQETRIAVFDTQAGLDAKPIRTFPAPRQVTIMATGADGSLYMGGRDVFRMDIQSGEYEIALASASLKNPGFSQRDVLTVWNIGSVSGEFIRLYSAAEFEQGNEDLERARWHWGYERVELKTGEVEDAEMGPLKEVLFTGMTRPGHKNEVYGVLNNLLKFDTDSKTQVASKNIDHSYYCINFSTDGNTIYLAGAANHITAFNADSLQQLGTITLPGDMSMSPTQVFSRPAGKL